MGIFRERDGSSLGNESNCIEITAVTVLKAEKMSAIRNNQFHRLDILSIYTLAEYFNTGRYLP